MNLLLDTHAILWMLDDDPRLPVTARTMILEAHDIRYSPASLWEIAIKLSIGRYDFRLSPDWSQVIPKALEANACRMLAISADHCERVGQLAWHHRDPFDRMLIAQAQCEDLTLLSCDQLIPQYQDLKHAW